jgi:torulene dioxygenase
MSIFKPAPVPGSTGPSISNIAVTIHPNMPGLPSSQSNESVKASSSTGTRNLWVATDNSRYKEIHPQTLEPLSTSSQKSLHPLLKGPLSGAHSQTDPQTGDIFNYNLELGLHATYRIFKTSFSTGETEILSTLNAKAAYIHSFFLSADYVILAIWSSVYSSNGINIPKSQNLLDAIAPFSSSNLTKWFVIDRHHGKGVVEEFESPAAFSFHSVNAWQEISATGEVEVLCEVVEFGSLDVLFKFYYENLTSGGKNALSFNNTTGQTCLPYLTRYRLSSVGAKLLNRSSLSTGIPKAKLELTIPKGKVGELPTINPSFATKEHRYVYGVVNRGYSTFVDGISKVDTKTGEALYWDEKGCTPGEAIFVADPEGEAEDGGVLLSVVLDGKGEKPGSFLLVLDARTMGELGRAEVGGVVGFGFHGCHVRS